MFVNYFGLVFIAMKYLDFISFFACLLLYFIIPELYFGFSAVNHTLFWCSSYDLQEMIFYTSHIHFCLLKNFLFRLTHQVHTSHGKHLLWGRMFLMQRLSLRRGTKLVARLLSDDVLYRTIINNYLKGFRFIF